VARGRDKRGSHLQSVPVGQENHLWARRILAAGHENTTVKRKEKKRKEKKKKKKRRGKEKRARERKEEEQKKGKREEKEKRRKGAERRDGRRIAGKRSRKRGKSGRSGPNEDPTDASRREVLPSRSVHLWVR